MCRPPDRSPPPEALPPPPRHAMLAIVRSLVISRVSYCLSVYGNGSATNEARLAKVINFASRVVTGLRKFDHVSRARIDLGLCTPRQMYDSRIAIVAHRVRMLGEPDELASLLCTFADARSCERVTGQDQCLRPPTARTAAGRRSFAHRAASLLNAVPDDVKRLNPAAFGRAAKRLFSDQ